MKRGIKFQPLPNPPVEPVPISHDQGEILGLPVRFDPHYGGVAEARGMFHMKHIIVGPSWISLDYRLKRAILLHEAAHCKGHHFELRLALVAAMAAPPMLMFPWWLIAGLLGMLAIYLCWEWLGRTQEQEADAFAVENGYGLEMARFLKAHHTGLPTMFYPDYAARMRNIERKLKQRGAEK